MKLSRILNKAIDYLTEYPKRMCGSNSNNGKGVNKLIAPYDISEASIRHQLVLFGKEPLYSDTPRGLAPHPGVSESCSCYSPVKQPRASKGSAGSI